jgi:hypothetical protein
MSPFLTFFIQFQGPEMLVASDGQGKIHYPHVSIHITELHFLTGKDLLKAYYIFVPARGSKMGVEPETAAFTFCSHCGTHILHAPSSHTNMLDINAECLDAGFIWSLSKTKHNLSHGVPCANQVLSHFPSTNFDTPDEIQSAIHASFPSQKYNEFNESRQHVTSVRLPKPSKANIHAKVTSPGTPSTSSTSVTEPIPLNGQSFSVVKEEFSGSSQVIMEPFLLTISPSHQFKRSHSSDSIPSSSTTLEESQITHVLVPSFGTELSSGGDSANIPVESLNRTKFVESKNIKSFDIKIPQSTVVSETFVTPQARDRLHFYMNKHLSSDNEKRKASTPKITNLHHTTESKSEATDKI